LVKKPAPRLFRIGAGAPQRWRIVNPDQAALRLRSTRRMSSPDSIRRSILRDGRPKFSWTKTAMRAFRRRVTRENPAKARKNAYQLWIT
jgi:hypothetical protein